MKKQLLVLALLAVPVLNGCALSSFVAANQLNPADVAEAAQLMEARGISGCAFLRGHGNPPAAQIELDFVYAWGDVEFTECVKALIDK